MIFKIGIIGCGLVGKKRADNLGKRGKLIGCYDIDFKKAKNEKLVGIGMVIKKMRGAMANYIISNKITSLEKIKNFNQFKFKFYEFNSKNNKFLFISK